MSNVGSIGGGPAAAPQLRPFDRTNPDQVSKTSEALDKMIEGAQHNLTQNPNDATASKVLDLAKQLKQGLRNAGAEGGISSDEAAALNQQIAVLNDVSGANGGTNGWASTANQNMWLQRLGFNDMYSSY